METSADIVTLSKVAEPVTPVVVIPTPDVPTEIFPVELLDGVTEVTVLNVLDPNTVELAVGPVITSVCAVPDKSVPTTVNV